MRGIQAMLLASFIGLVGLGIWNARQWLPRGAVKSILSFHGDGKTGNGGPVVDKSNAKARILGKRRNGLALSAMGDVSVSRIDVEIPAHPRFPTRADLAVGATGVQIRTQYGEPTARVTEMRAGHLLERYYYFNRDRTQLTLATLEGGVIVAAETLSR